MTSLEPDVSVWRHVSFTLDPAWTLMTVLVDCGVPLGAPLHAMLLDVTSWTGWGASVSVSDLGEHSCIYMYICMYI